MLIDIANTTSFNRHISSAQELEIARYNRQWNTSSAITATKANLEGNTAVFLFGVFGTGITIVSDGKTLMSGASNPNFQNAPLALSTNGFSITGTVSFIYGFYV